MSLKAFRAYLSSAEEECSHSGIFEYSYAKNLTLELTDELGKKRTYQIKLIIYIRFSIFTLHTFLLLLSLVSTMAGRTKAYTSVLGKLQSE